jgi:hypothetical protein
VLVKIGVHIGVPADFILALVLGDDPEGPESSGGGGGGAGAGVRRCRLTLSNQR